MFANCWVQRDSTMGSAFALYVAGPSVTPSMLPLNPPGVIYECVTRNSPLSTIGYGPHTKKFC